MNGHNGASVTVSELDTAIARCLKGEQAGYDARWVARFVSACANADMPTAEALFGAAMVDGQLAECLLTLAGSTVATLRHRAG